jgi:aminodeoxyfutalosine deaminase
MPSAVRVLHADVVLAGDGPGLFDGAVAVDETGLVLDVGKAGEILPAHGGAFRERIAGVLLPALVNAHTHVELSALRGKVKGGTGFVPWLEQLIAARAADEPDQDAPALARAVRELDRAGTAAVGDVGNTAAAVGPIRQAGIGGIGFREVVGLDPVRTGAFAAAIGRELASPQRPSGEDADFVLAPAPHTVYATHPDTVRALLALARELGRRSTVHLAEHAAERIFLERRTGPFADFVRRMRVDSPRFPLFGKGPVAVAADLGLLAPDVLLVHLTDANAEEIGRIAQSGAPVVLCPRSNLYIENRLPPVMSLIEAGIIPALGTDSLASNESLDLLEEARALHDRLPDLPARLLLEMATAAGARAVGRSDLGRIARGTRPGILAFEGSCDGQDPFAWLLADPPPRRRWVARRASGKKGHP